MSADGVHPSLEYASYLLRGAQRDLAQHRRRRRPHRRVKAAKVSITVALRHLDALAALFAAEAAHVQQEAVLDLREAMFTALGPDLVVSGVDGARKALTMVLDLLPVLDLPPDDGRPAVPTALLAADAG
jgi:hypothetical protein